MINLPALGTKRCSLEPTAGESRWLHVCNGLDPERDGGMVPSILGMAGGLARHGENVTIVTPTPSRLDAASVDPRLTIAGPDADLRAAVHSADIVHIHGLWQAHVRQGRGWLASAACPI